MIARTFLLLFVAVLPLLAQSSPPGYETVQLGNARSSGHYIVDVLLDRKPLRFVVDSGAAMAIVLSKPTAKALRKRTVSAGEASRVTETVKMRKTKVKSFNVVGLSPVLKDTEAFVIDLGEVQIYEDNQAITPDGLLGVSILDQWNAVLDTGMGRLLVPASRMPGTSFTKWMQRRGAIVAPLQKASNGFAMLDVTIKKRTYTFLVDSGAGLNTIEPDVARRLRLKLVGEGAEIAGIGKKVIKGLDIAEAEDVVLGGTIKVQKLQFSVHGRSKKIVLPPGKAFGGIIGSRTLSAMNACLDFGTYSLIVPKPEETQSTTEDTLGLTPEKLKQLIVESEKPELPTNPEPAEKPDSMPQPPPVQRGF